MLDKNLTESEREIKNSPERRGKRFFNIACAAICISLTGGFIYYVNDLMSTGAKLNNISSEKFENIDDAKEFLKNYELTNEDKQLFDNNTVKINDTEYDEYGRPRLEAGHDKEWYKDPSHYTFKDNGMGEPVEAPPKGVYVIVINPNTGMDYTYNSSNYWRKDVLRKSKQDQEWMDKVQSRQMSATGIPYEERKISTDEEIHNYVQGMVINMGSGAGN